MTSSHPQFTEEQQNLDFIVLICSVSSIVLISIAQFQYDMSGLLTSLLLICAVIPAWCILCRYGSTHQGNGQGVVCKWMKDGGYCEEGVDGNFVGSLRGNMGGGLRYVEF